MNEQTGKTSSVKWFNVIDPTNTDEAFEKVAYFNGDVYFAAECFNLDRTDAVSLIREVNGDAFVLPTNGQLSGIYIPSKTMEKALKLKEATSEELKEFSSVVAHIREQILFTQALQNFKPTTQN